MKASLWAAALVTGLVGPVGAETFCTAIGPITDCTTTGNLAPAQDRGCIALEAADAGMSPADLSLSVLACVRKGRAADAAELMALMMARGRFDAARVADKTAHQAPMVLQMEITAALSEQQTRKFDRALKEMVADPGGADYADFCARVAGLGVPTHDPGYMLAHGMRGGGLVKGFRPKAAWAKVKTQFLKCPA